MTASDQRDQWEASGRARLLLVLVAVLWSTGGLFAKAPWLLAWPGEVRGTLLAFWRALFAGLFLLPFVRRPQWSWRLVPATLVFAAMNVTFLTAMSHTTAANAIWLQNTAPCWVLMFSVFYLRPKVTRKDGLMLALGLSGVALILTFELSSSAAANQKGVLWGVMAGITYSGVIITVRWLRDLDPVWIIALNHLVTAFLLWPLVIHEGVFPNATQTLWLACFGVLQMGLPYVLFARALRYVPSHEAAILVLLEPVLVPVWVYLAWRHHPSYQAPAWWTLAGAACILAGLVARYATRSGRRSAQLED